MYARKTEMFCYVRQTTMMKKLLLSHLVFLWIQNVTGIILISPALPEVSTRATLSCYSAQTGRYWYHQGVLMTTCNSQSCLPKEKTQHGYTFTADNDKAEVTILSLDRTRDGGSWVCATGFNQSISLDVYSFPSGISFTQGGATDVDLGESQTILQCQTDGCTYPAPNIWWYFKDIAPSAPRTFYKDTGTQVTGGSCTSPEELYTSSLVLPLYTIWQENIDKNVTLSCGIEYSNVSRNVYSQESKQIRYAVRVSEAVIQENNQNITDTLNVTAGVTVTMTCLTGTSRPSATVVWYLGSQLKGSGAIWNFTPIAADHNGTFLCQVYNTDQNKKIVSNKARLYVRVPIDSVQLRNGTALTLNEGQLAVLVCETGACRPSAAINWMKNGIDIMDSPTGVTEINVGNDLFVSMGMLNYTGQRGDNGKRLTCRAYNGLGSGQTSGSLAVTVYYPPEGPPEIDDRVNGSRFTVIANTSQLLTCRVIGGNPLANLSWICVGHIGISNTSGQTVTSVIVLAVGINAQNQRCTCRTSHPAGRNMDVFVLLQVHYPPFIQLQTSPYKVIENQTLSLTCQVDSNPLADQIFWFPSGDGSVSSSLYFSSVSRNNKGIYSCTAKNTMTPTVGGQQIGMNTSQMEVDVLYPPFIHGLTSQYQVIENQSLSVICQVNSNPPPNQIFWKPSGEGSVPSRLYFSSVSRSNKGIYSCTATNTMTPTSGRQQNGTGTSQIQVDVLYAAKITEFVVKGNVSEILEHSTLELYCRVDSNPYSVISLFFGDVLISTIQDAHELINTITTGCLSAGKYICSATNSVMNGVTVSVEVNLKVQCGPRLDNRKNISTEYYRALNDNVTLEVYVIAYPEPTDIMWYHRAAKTSIWQQVPNQSVSSSGLFASITVHLGNQGDFGDYLVNMTNSFGIYDLLFRVIPESPPQMVDIFYISRFIANQIELHFKSGFNGGHVQTFAIEYKSTASPESPWKNSSVTDLKETQSPDGTYFINITQAPPGNYEYRMYSWNDIGRSPYSVVITIFIPGGASQTSSSTDTMGNTNQITLIVSAVLFCLAACLFTAALVLFFRSMKGCKNDTSATGPNINDIGLCQPMEDDGVSNLNANTQERSYLYEDLNNHTRTMPVYEELSKGSERPSKSGNHLYSNMINTSTM